MSDNGAGEMMPDVWNARNSIDFGTGNMSQRMEVNIIDGFDDERENALETCQCHALGALHCSLVPVGSKR